MEDNEAYNDTRLFYEEYKTEWDKLVQVPLRTAFEALRADEGSWGANKRIYAAHDVDLTGVASGTTMKYKITTHNQSASKVTRIHAASLAWA